MKVEGVNEGAPAATAGSATAQTPANGVSYVTASDGRRFGLKKLKPSARFKLSETFDVKTQSGELQRLVVATVFSIDDEAFPPLKDMDDLLRRLDEIGDEGLAAVTGPALNLYGTLSQKDVEIAKNS